MLLENVFFGNTVEQWLIALAVALISLGALYLLVRVLFKKISSLARRTTTELDDLIARLIGKTKFLFLLILSIYIGSLFVSLSVQVNTILSRVVIIILLFQMALWGSGLINHWVNRYKKQKLEVDAASATTFGAMGYVGQIILWSIVLLLALDNLGVDITTLVAGLGVTGIAVALAVQNILGDLFASLSIVLDKPFVIGDFVIIDNYLGTIEHIGLKTTRIRSLSGEQLVFSNNDLLRSRIRNYKRMFERRVVFSIGVTYQTPHGKVAAIPEMIKEIIESKDNVRFDRAHFKAYGDFSLIFEIVYWVTDPDYNVYMNIQQSINLDIYQRFEQEGIEFAFPTQTLYVNKIEKAVIDATNKS